MVDTLDLLIMNIALTTHLDGASVTALSACKKIKQIVKIQRMMVI